LSFTLAIAGGIATGFKGYTHNPPLPYILEILILPIGLILFGIDLVITRPLHFKNIGVHILGLGANAAVIAATLFVA